MNKLNKIITISCISGLGLLGCGGSGSDSIDTALNTIANKSRNIADDIKASYEQVENKLTNSEKDTATILKSIFLPEESLDVFLDKITPEGGKGGLYVGYFVEENDSDSSDIDIGSVYFDIGNDFAESVYGQMSYQQKACQNLNTLTTENIAIKTDTLISGIFSGTLDPIAKFDNDLLNTLKFDEIKTVVTGMPFNGNWDKNIDSWNGNYTYQLGIKLDKKLSSNIDGCSVQYTLSNQGNFKVYPLYYQLGELNLQFTGVGSAKNLQWSTPNNTAYTLVSQIDIQNATNRGNGFIRNEVISQGQSQFFTPVVHDTTTNYAFVVQAFDQNNQLIGYQAIIQNLP